MGENNNWLLLLGLGAVAVVGFMLIKGRHPIETAAPSLFGGPSQALASGQYTNEERWEVSRSEDGRIQTITIHRDARTG